MKLEILHATNILEEKTFKMVGQVLRSNHGEHLGEIMSRYLLCIWSGNPNAINHIHYQTEKLLRGEFGRYNAALVKKFAAFNETTWRKWATTEFLRAVDQEIQRQIRRRFNACNQRRAILLGKTAWRHGKKPVPKAAFSCLLEDSKMVA